MNAFCAKAPGPARECGVAEALAPVTITSAVLKFSAASAQEAKAGGSLKLISAAQTRKYDRISSFEIELTPDPAKVNALRTRNKDKGVYELDELGALLLAALNFEASCSARESSREPGPDQGRGLKCNTTTPQLILKSAKFALDISYTQSSSGDIKWSVSSLKLEEGTAGFNNSRSVGNTLTVELARSH